MDALSFDGPLTFAVAWSTKVVVVGVAVVKGDPDSVLDGDSIIAASMKGVIALDTRWRLKRCSGVGSAICFH